MKTLRLQVLFVCVVVASILPNFSVQALGLSSGCMDVNSKSSSKIGSGNNAYITGGTATFEKGEVIIISPIADTPSQEQVQLAVAASPGRPFKAVAGPIAVPGILTYTIPKTGGYVFGASLAGTKRAEMPVDIRCLPGSPIAKSSTNPLGPGSNELIANTNGTSVPLLSGPEASATTITNLPNGQLVTLTVEPLLIQNVTWYRVATDFAGGWIKGQGLVGKNPTDPLIPYSEQSLAQSIVQLSAAIKSQGDPALLLSRAIAYKNQGKATNALADLANVVKPQPKNATAYLIQASIEFTQNDYQRAVATLTAVISQTANDPLLYQERAEAYFVLRNYTAALKDDNAALKLNPQDSIAYVDRGRIWSLSGNHTQATTDFDQARQIDGLFSGAYFYQGVDFDLQNNWLEAIGWYSQAIHVNPAFIDAFQYRGEDYVNLEDYPAAIQDLKYVISQQPTNAWAFLYLGEADEYLPDYPAAIDNLNKALQYAKQDNACLACTYFHLGRVYFAQTSYDKAIDNYTQAIEIDPHFGNAYLGRAKAYEAIGDTAKAQADNAKAQELTNAGINDSAP